MFLMTECSVYRKIQFNQGICDPSNLKPIQVALFQSFAALNEAQVKKINKKYFAQCVKSKSYHQICRQFCLFCVCAANFGPVDCLSTRLFLDGPKIAEEFEVNDFLPQSVCTVVSLNMGRGGSSAGPLLDLCWSSAGPRCFRAGTFSL